MNTKKIMCLAFLCLIYLQNIAQTQIKESIKFTPGQKINISFKYPKLVKITTWDRNEVEVTGEVTINNGKNDDTFKITSEIDNDILFISSTIKDHETLPKMKVLIIGDTSYYFDGDESYATIERLKEKEGNHLNSYSMYGVIKEITLEVKIPENTALSVDAKHGLVELKSINAPVKVVSKFGGIDISIAENARKTLELSTRFGEVFTNMDLTFENNIDHRQNHWQIIKGTLNGGGLSCQLESKFGNIYVRKDN